jgi:sugar-specific transcriptional regulator TrmB
MIEEKVLKDLGLTEIEAKVYLAALELGQDTVLHIAKKAGVKRPTCYVALDTLFGKGLVTKIEKKTTTFYAVESPKLILNKYKEKLNNLEDLIPLFEAKFNKSPKPKIRFYEGKEELFNVSTKIIYSAKEMYFFGTDIEKFTATFPDLLDYFDESVKNYKQKNKIIMEIVSANPAGRIYQKKYGKSRPIKIMPADLPVFADVSITENKIFIISLNNLFGVLIESEDLAKTFKNFFLLAWQAAK